jgi:hypothetical protein
VPDDDDGRRSGPLVRLDETPAHQRRDPRQPERRRADLGHLDRLAAAIAGDQVALERAVRAKVPHGRQLRAPRGEVVRHVRLHPTPLRVPVLDRHDATAVRQRERRANDLRDHLESGRADPDRERDGESADERQPRVPQQHPEAELEVQPGEAEVVETAKTARLASLLLVSLCAAELESCLASRLSR